MTRLKQDTQPEDEELAHSWQHYGEIGSNYGYTGTGTSMPSSPLDA